MSIKCINYYLQHILVTGVELDTRVEFHPANVGCVISGSERELANLGARVIMEMKSHSLHPSIVRVSWIIHISSIHFLSRGKKLSNHCFQFLKVVFTHTRRIKSFLHKFPFDRDRHLFSWIHHSTRNGPFSTVLPLNANKFQNLLSCFWIFDNITSFSPLPPRYNWISGMIRSPSSKNSSS